VNQHAKYLGQVILFDTQTDTPNWNKTHQA